MTRFVKLSQVPSLFVTSLRMQEERALLWESERCFSVICEHDIVFALQLVFCFRRGKACKLKPSFGKT